jgi:hypothetical protein
MDGTQFDHLTRILTHSRRSLLGGGLAGVTGLLVGATAESRKRRKRNKRKGEPPQPNEYGCLNFGARCTSAADCCSGICERQKRKGRRKGKRRCGAHDTGKCDAGALGIGCGDSANVACVTSRGEAGVCTTTTGHAPYCRAAYFDYPCKTDLDCQTANGGQLGPRAACVRCSASITGSICAVVAGTPA